MNVTYVIKEMVRAGFDETTREKFDVMLVRPIYAVAGSGMNGADLSPISFFVGWTEERSPTAALYLTLALDFVPQSNLRKTMFKPDIRLKSVPFWSVPCYSRDEIILSMFLKT